MSKNVDDIWKALKASTAPRDTSESGRSSTVLADSLSVAFLQETQHSNAQCGHVLQSSSSEYASAECIQDNVYTQRDVNCLSDPDRTMRRQAIKKLSTLISNTAPNGQDQSMMDFLQSESLQGKVVLMLSDPTDLCREAAVDVIRAMILAAPEGSTFVIQALQALRLRMGVGHPFPLEDSEEIRLKVSSLTSTVVISKVSTSDKSAICDVAAVLSRCLDDSFHETKKSACMGVKALTDKYSNDDLSGVCSAMTNSLLDILRHPHSRVRAAGMQALTALGEKTPFAVDLLASKVVPALRMTAVDKSAELRAATYHACSTWLIQYAGSVSGDASMPHLLPILLLGVTDSNAEAANETVAILSQVGKATCADSYNTSGMFEADQRTSEVDIAAASILPPPLDTRAPAVLRAMINDQLPTILPPMLHDVKEWTATVRSTASRSLYCTMALAEHGLTPHLERILPCLCQAVGDEDESITAWIIHCIHVVGAFCEVRTSLVHNDTSCISLQMKYNGC